MQMMNFQIVIVRVQFHTCIHNTPGYISDKLAHLVRIHYAPAFEASGGLNLAIASDLLTNDSYRAHGSEPYHSSSFKNVVYEFIEIEKRAASEPIPVPATQLAFIELKVSSVCLLALRQILVLSYI